ncbi:MAG: hypothetical protein HY720_24705 [Planctomycetes bacterium]|nr:hypothetical protein [Planctomycetota bacterium]
MHGIFRRSGVSVLPVVAGRLADSLELLRAVREERPRLVILDLPRGIETVAREAAREMPRPSVGVRRVGMHVEGVPFTPATAWGLAIRLPALLGSLESWFRSMRILFSGSEGPWWGEAAGEGSEGPVREEPAEGGRREDSCPGEVCRVGRVAEGLAKMAHRGRPVLLLAPVRAAAHWVGHLEGRVRVSEVGGAPRSTGPWQLFPVDPERAYVAGWLDDAPNPVWQFWTALCEGRPFDPVRAREAIEARAIRQAEKLGEAPSVRAMIRFEELERKITAAAGRRHPALDSQWVPSAAACVGELFAWILKCEAMRYPVGAGETAADGEGSEDTYPRRPERWNPLPRVEERREPLPGIAGERPEGAYRHAADAIHPRELIRVPEEARLQFRVTSMVRRLAHRKRRDRVSRSVIGAALARPDVRGTIRARGAGAAKALKVWRPRSQHQRCDGFCPVIYLFDASDREKSPPGRWSFCAYSSGWIWGTREFLERDVVRFRVSRFLDLFVDRENGRCMRRDDEEPFWHSLAQPRVRPVAVPATALASFRDPEDFAVAMAVHFAHDHCVCVSKDYHPGSPVREYARQRGVALLLVPMAALPARRLERCRLQHMVPTGPEGTSPDPWAMEIVPLAG